MWGRNLQLGCISAFAVLMLSAKNSEAFYSAGNTFYINSTYSGHEEITRQALNRVAKRIKESDDKFDLFDLKDLNYDLQPEPKGLFGYKSQNMVILGNFASDFPSQVSVFSLEKFWNNNNLGNFDDPTSQANHFLRNYIDNFTLASAMETCRSAREKIKFVVTEALKFWDAGDKTKALFLIGHATHTVQDSFSPAHTIRDNDTGGNKLLNICYFGSNMHQKMPAIRESEMCYHASPDSKDAIWNIDPQRYKEALKNWKAEGVSQCDTAQNYPNTEEEKDSCMGNEARLARVATEKFLFLIFNHIKPENLTRPSNEIFIKNLDANLFDGPVGVAALDAKMPNGIMSCDTLSDKRVSIILTRKQLVSKNLNRVLNPKISKMSKVGALAPANKKPSASKYKTDDNVKKSAKLDSSARLTNKN